MRFIGLSVLVFLGILPLESRAQDPCLQKRPFEEIDALLDSLGEKRSLSTDFTGMKEPQWKNAEDFRAFVGSQEFVLEKPELAQFIYLHLRTHPENLKWIVDELLQLVDSRSQPSSRAAVDAISDLRALYLTSSERTFLDAALAQWIQGKSQLHAGEIEKLRAHLMDSAPHWIQLAQIEDEIGPSYVLARLSIVLSAQMEISKSQPDLRASLLAKFRESFQQIQKAGASIETAFLRADAREASIKQTIDRLTNLKEIPEADRDRALEFLKRVMRTNEVDWRLSTFDNPFSVLFGMAELNGHQREGNLNKDAWGYLYYNPLLRQMLEWPEITEAERSFLTHQIELTSESLQVKYARLLALEPKKDELLKDPTFPREMMKNGIFLELGDAYGAEEQDIGYFITWTWALAALSDPEIPEWMIQSLRRLVDESANPFALPYMPIPRAIPLSERDSAARAPMVHYALYVHAIDETDRKLRRENLLLSLERNFVSNLGSLLVRANRPNSGGNHELKEYGLPPTFQQDSLAPYYYFPTLPWIAQAIESLERDPKISDSQKLRLQSIREWVKKSTLAAMDPNGDFIPEGPDMSTLAYNNAFGALAFWKLFPKAP